MVEQLWHQDEGSSLWKPAAQELHDILERYNCKRLSKWWYFDSPKGIVIHVCKVHIDEHGLPGYIGTLNEAEQICDKCLTRADKAVLMVARLQKLKDVPRDD